MSELGIYPAELAEMSVSQLANLPPLQLIEASVNLDQLIAWVKKARTKLDAAAEQRLGARARQCLIDTGREYGTTHFNEGPMRVTFDLPKRVSWDQKQLAAIAERIAAAGERIQDYMDVDLSVSESRYNSWPPALKEQFASARTTKPGKATFSLKLNDEGSL